MSTDYFEQVDFVHRFSGAQELVDWFGYFPSFHDWTMSEFNISDASARLVFNGFRMTDEVDAEGYFVLDRHAVVTVQLHQVSGLQMIYCPTPILSSLMVRQVSDEDLASSDSFNAIKEVGFCPRLGDFEVILENVYGVDGSLFCNQMSFELKPTSSIQPLAID